MHTLAKRLRRLISWPGNPWHVARFSGEPMGHLHRLAAKYAFSRMPGSWGWLLALLLTLTWPPRLLFQAWQHWHRLGVAVQESGARSRWRQLVDLLVLGIGYGLPPLAYYRYRLFVPANRARLGAYLYEHEAPALFQYLNGFRVDPAVEDKRLFAERCIDAGLACVPTLAWGDGDQVRWVQEDWPAGDLISKPAVGCRGEGVRWWRELKAGCYGGADGRCLGRAELLRALASASGGKEWLLQPALDNHEGIADLSPQPLIAIRLLTARNGDGDAAAFAAVLKMPVGRQIVNNHGIGSAIDLETGMLGRAFPYRPLHRGFDCHPNTGAQIVGRQLPAWTDAMQLALRAHALFPDMRSLGWDVALTPTGPVLLETNSGWDVAMPQIALQRPLGETLFPMLCERFKSS